MKINIGNIKVQKKIEIGNLKFGVKKVYPELEDLEVTPTTEEQLFKSEKYGFDNVHIKKVTADIDENIKPEHIKEGVNILGVDGGYSGIDTSDATATEADLLKDKTAYANGKQITGTIEEYDGSLSGNVEIGDEDLIPENIREGVEILGVVGTMKDNGGGNAVIDDTLLTENTNTSSFYYPLTFMITKVPKIDTSKWISTSNLFRSTNITEVPEIDTSNVTDMSNMFYACIELNKIPELNASKIIKPYNAFFNCAKLTEFGGLKNLGKAYTEKTANYNSYTLSFAGVNNLTHDSLMNIINGLYDLNLTYNVANGGTLYTQKLQLSSPNLAKLTAEEIAIATSKGWTVS